MKNLSYRAELFNSQTFGPGQSGTFEFKVLEEGDYVFFCILYGHQNKGQEGILSVQR